MSKTLALVVTLGFVCIAAGVNAYISFEDRQRIERQERIFISNGIPTTACLLEVLERAQPLIRQRAVRRPLESFLILRHHRRFAGLCPTPAAAQRIALTLPVP